MQGISLTTFILVRHLSGSEFGIFALLYGLVLLGLNVNNWLLRTLLATAFSTASDKTISRLITSLLFVSVLAAGAVSLALIGGAAFLHHLSLFPALILVAVSTQTQETLRRAAMADGQILVAIFPDAISYLGQAAILAILGFSSHITLQSAFWVVGFTSLLAAFTQLHLLDARLGPLGECWSAARRCWSQGSFVLIAGVLSLVPVYVMQWGVAFARGPAESGRFAAIIAILGVGHPLMTSVGWLVLFNIGRWSKQNARLRSREMLRVLVPSVSLLAGYWVFLAIFPSALLQLAFGTRFVAGDIVSNLRLAVLYYCFFFGAICLELTVDGLQLARFRIWVEVCSAVLMFVVGIPVILGNGLKGALLVGMACQCMRILGCFLLLHRSRGSNGRLQIESTVSQALVSPMREMGAPSRSAVSAAIQISQSSE